MKVSIRYFASLRETIGRSGEVVETTASNLAQLRQQLIASGPLHAQALTHGRTVRMALNQVMCADESAGLVEGDEVAFFPPVTGG